MKRETQLLHYTSSIEAVVSILQNGFLLIPNKRHLIETLVGRKLTGDREPQEFGMVCFSEVATEQTSAHRDRFGNFAIGVSWEWARSNGAERVLYIAQQGEVLNSLKYLFELAYRDLKAKIDYPDDGILTMAYTNKNMAKVLGAEPYVRMLTLYEYMQPEKDSPQVEWRIVQPAPFRFSCANKLEMVNQILDVSRKWKNCAVPVTPGDVTVLLCPEEKLTELRAVLPPLFATPVRAYSQLAQSCRLAALLHRAGRFLLQLFRVVVRDQGVDERL